MTRSTSRFDPRPAVRRGLGARAACALVTLFVIVSTLSMLLMGACESSSPTRTREPGTADRENAAPQARQAPQANQAAASSASNTAAQPGAVTPAPPRPAIDPSPESVESWTFNGKPGQIITTPHYRVFTTHTRQSLTSRLPLFLESALQHYTRAITGENDPLPLPDVKLDTYILAAKADWEVLARQLLGDQATPYLNIRRGGFAYGGRALLFDLGPFDTLAVTAHEGWHQYTQRTFESTLPVWLEEGIATYMEGHRWSGRGGRATFMPWANVERFDALRRAHSRGSLISLQELLNTAPQNLISAGSSGPGLTYYAQVWALTHFLMEGEGGKHRAAFRELVKDAASGRLERSLSRRLGSPRAGRGMSSKRGPAVFLAYFNSDLAQAEVEYQRFITQVVVTGQRQSIVAGDSPIEALSSADRPSAPAAPAP